MTSSGNSSAACCMGNLLGLVRGSVPYSRMKGLDSTLIDRPSGLAIPLMLADAEWLLEQYEPRLSIDGIDLVAEIARSGTFTLEVNAGEE